LPKVLSEVEEYRILFSGHGVDYKMMVFSVDDEFDNVDDQ